MRIEKTVGAHGDSSLMLDTEVSSNENRWFAFGERKPHLYRWGEDVTLCIELYADKMFINAEDIVIDSEKYELP